MSHLNLKGPTKDMAITNRKFMLVIAMHLANPPASSHNILENLRE